MAGFFQNFFTGNPNKAEFTKEMLPKNRRELFAEMLKLNLWNLIKANSIYLLFTIPMWVNIWAHSRILIDMAQASADGLTVDGIRPFFSEGYLAVFLIAMVPCLLLQGPAKAALKYLVRKWAMDDHASSWSDFWYAFRANLKQGLSLGLLNGLLFLLLPFAFLFYNGMSAQGMIYFVLEVLVGLIALIAYFVNLYAWPMMVSYEMGLKTILQNSLIMAIGRLPFTLLYFIIGLVPAVICLFFPIALVYYFLIGYSFHAFVNVSYTNSAFDLYINPRVEGAEIGRGMYKPPEDEYEYVDIDDDDYEDKPKK
ncbi:MAG: DUF624 domain-containing protein [Christensenellaceae bacterium]|jgi:uncharacterized membrane protein YesL|nr:DUF624 domain-containing protein [Christensenellaceae bacterium]